MRWCICPLSPGVGVVLWLSSFFCFARLGSACEGGFSCILFGFYDRLYESFCSHSEREHRGAKAVSNVAKGRLGIVSVISFYCINILWYGLGYVALRIFNLCR